MKTGQRERGSRHIYIRTSIDDYKFEMKYFVMLKAIEKLRNIVAKIDLSGNL
jgi:hypothetical protein